MATNVVYGSHPYNQKGTSNYTYNGVKADFATNFAGLKGVAPLIFTEFGDSTSSDYVNNTWKTIDSNQLAEINNNNISYSAFGWWIDDTQPWFPTLITGSWDNPIANNYTGSLISQDLTINPGTVFTIN